MAGKEFPLTIALRVDDNASAHLRALQSRLGAVKQKIASVELPEKLRAAEARLREVTTKARLAAVTLPTIAPRGFSTRLGALADRLRPVRAGVAEIGSALAHVGRAAKGLAFGLGGLVAAVGAFGLAFKSAVDDLDELGKSADRLSLGVNTLAELRFAADRAGASTEDFDRSMETFVKRIGEAKAGTGPLVSSLGRVSPALLRQVKAAKTTEQAFLIVSDAIAKLEDPTKRAALASFAFGRAGQKLDPMLKRGASGILAMRLQYRALVGDQEKAAEAAGEFNDGLDSAKLATRGIKAALVEGLAPPLKDIAERMGAFLAGNRERIRAWARDFGEKLPGRLAVLGEKLSWLVARAREVGAVAAAVIRAGVAFGEKLMWVRDKVAIVGAKLFWLLSPFTMIVAHLEDLKRIYGEVWDWIVAKIEGAWNKIQPIISKVTSATSAIKGALSTGTEGVRGAVQGVFGGSRATETSANELVRSIVTPGASGRPVLFEGGQSFLDTTLGFAQQQQARIEVDFKNLPRGARVEQSAGNTADIDVTAGYQMVTP